MAGLPAAFRPTSAASRLGVGEQDPVDCVATSLMWGP